MKTKKQERAEGIAKAMELVASEVIEKDPSVAYINDLKRFIRVEDYSSNPSTPNVVLRIVDRGCFVADLSVMIDADLRHLPSMDIRDLFRKHKRIFQSKVEWYKANKDLVDQHNLKTKDMEYEWERNNG